MADDNQQNPFISQDKAKAVAGDILSAYAPKPKEPFVIPGSTPDAPYSIPGYADRGPNALDPSVSQPEFAGQLLHKIIGSDIEPKDVPLEGYGAAAKGKPVDPGAIAGVERSTLPEDVAMMAVSPAAGLVAKKLVRPGAEILGNEIGAINIPLKNGLDTKVLKNPSFTQAKSLFNKSQDGTVKAIKDKSTGDVFMWDAYDMHHREAADALGVPFENTNSFEIGQHIDDNPIKSLEQFINKNKINAITKSPPSAKFIGYQEFGDKSLPLFNIEGEGHALNGSTVSAKTLKKEGISVPEIPSLEEWKNPKKAKSGRISEAHGGMISMAEGGEVDLMSESNPQEAIASQGFGQLGRAAVNAIQDPKAEPFADPRMQEPGLTHPILSPDEMITGAAGAKIGARVGRALAGPAEQILSNEIGAIGKNVAPKITSINQHPVYRQAAEKYQAEGRTLGNLSAKIEQEAMNNNIEFQTALYGKSGIPEIDALAKQYSNLADVHDKAYDELQNLVEKLAPEIQKPKKSFSVLNPKANLSPSAQATLKKIQEKDLTFFNPKDFDKSFIAKDERGSPIGHLGIDEDFRTQSIKVDPDHQGEGIASKLYERALDKTGLLRSSHRHNQLEGGRGLWDKFEEENPYHVRQARDPNTLQPLDYKVWEKDTNIPLRKQEMKLESNIDDLYEKLRNAQHAAPPPDDRILKLNSQWSQVTNARDAAHQRLFDLHAKTGIPFDDVLKGNTGNTAIDEAAKTYENYTKMRNHIRAQHEQLTYALKSSRAPTEVEKYENQIKDLVDQWKKINKKSKHTMYATGGMVTSAPSSTPTLDPGARVWHYGTNQEVYIPHDRVDEGVSSGQFSFLKNSPHIPVFNPDGQLGYIPPEYGSKALESGFKYASPAAIHEYELNKEYGDRPFASAALGAANTASFGTANQLLAKTGLVSQEALKEIPERNPKSHFVGSLGGIGASLLVPGSPVARAAELGTGIAEGVAGALPSAASTAGKILSSGLAKGIGGAAEGALYGAGDVIGEQALGNPNFNADAVASHLGYSALLGGALGSAIGTSEVALPEAITAAKETLGNLKSKVWGEAGEGKLGDAVNKLVQKGMSKASGIAPEDIATAARNVPLIDTIGEDLQKSSKSLTKDYQNLITELEKASKKAASDIRPQEINELLKDDLHGVNPEKVYDQFAQVHHWVNEAVQTMRSEPELYSPSYARSLEQYLERFLGKPSQELMHVAEEGLTTGKLAPHEILPGSPSDVYAQMDELKRLIQDMSKYQNKESFVKPSIQEINSQDLVKKLAAGIRSSLEDPSAWGEAGARQAAYNSATHDIIGAIRDVKKAFGKLSGEPGAYGSQKYKLHESKFERFLKSKDESEVLSKATALKNLEASADRYFDQLEKSYANVPDEIYDAAHVADLASRAKAGREEAGKLKDLNEVFSRMKPAESESLVNTEGMGAAIAHTLGVPGPVIAAAALGHRVYKTLANPLLTFQRLAKLEKMVAKVNKTITTGANSLFKTGTSALENTKGFLASKAAPKPSDNASYQDRVEKLNKLSLDTEGLMDKLQAVTSPLEKHAPQNAQALMTTTARAVSFLQSKIPQTDQGGPLDKKMPPNMAEKTKFNRYFNAVEHPTAVFSQMKAGLLTPEAVEAISTVYPSLYDQMKTEIMDALVSHKDVRISSQLKNQMSMFLGENLTQNAKPMSILQNQSILNGAEAQQNQQDAQFVKTTSKGLGNISLSERSLTSSQENARRER